MRCLGSVLCAVVGMLGLASWSSGCDPDSHGGGGDHNTLTQRERATGWRLLFDGRSTDQWRGFRKDGFPDRGWRVVDGVLEHVDQGGGGDIITREKFGDFELVLEFSCSPGANSGIMYRVAETADATYMTGPEFQVLDDSGVGAALDAAHSAGAMYDLARPMEGKTLNPAGEWNHARIRVRDGVVQHFLNGVKVVDKRIDDEAWTDAIAASKFRDWAGFGVQPSGHIAIQDHGNAVRFRNLKVRDLDAPMPGEVVLFNGESIEGWTAFVPDLGGASPEAFGVWRIEDGVLVCEGKPVGYIRTSASYDNFVLRLRWRWPEGKEPGNSGVLIRQIGEDKVWPKSVEAQLHSGNAGDFWNIGDFAMTADPVRTKGRNTKKLVAAERAIGQWNEYEIIADGGLVQLWVNGELCNAAVDVEAVAGKICLQSEGAEIHFRDVRLSPLPRE